MTKTDLQLKQDFEQAHRSDPKVKAAHIGLIVDQGSVALLGCCRHPRDADRLEGDAICGT